MCERMVAHQAKILGEVHMGTDYALSLFCGYCLSLDSIEL